MRAAKGLVIAGALVLAGAGVVGLALGLVAGEKAPAPAEKSPFAKVTYSDSGGFAGGGTGKRLVVTADGRFKVGREVPPHSGDLTRAELAELRKRVAAVSWESIQKRYVGGEGTIVEDLVVLAEEKPYETHVDEAGAPPPPLRNLLDCLARLHKTYQKGPKQAGQ